MSRELELEAGETQALTCETVVSAPRSKADEDETVQSEPLETIAATRDSTTARAVGLEVPMSPSEVMGAKERERQRAMSVVSLSTALIFIAMTVLLDRPTLVKGLAIGGAGAVVIGNLLLLRVTRNSETYANAPLAPVWVFMTIGIQLMVLFFGSFSAALVAFVFALYFISLENSRSVAISIYITFALGHLTVASLFVAGFAPDPGLMSSEDLSRIVLVVGEVLVQAVLLGIFIIARLSRKAILASVVQHQETVRALAQRDALLEEARADFARALKGGGIGRFSGAKLGSFRLSDVLGRGAMGEVYRAIHDETHQLAAVKVLLIETLSDPKSLTRFRREAHIVSSLSSPHVAAVLEVSDASAVVPYIAMELLDGDDLKTILRRKHLLAPSETLEVLHQLARGLDEANHKGIVHRDIKPQNVFRTTSGVWKLLDFGISKSTDSGETLTGAHVIGTPAYMAPEQARGEEVDHRTDLYALGAVAYRCLVGRAPHTGSDLRAVLHGVLSEKPPRPSSLVNFPSSVDEFFRVALAKRPSDRFQSASELVVAFEKLCVEH